MRVNFSSHPFNAGMDALCVTLLPAHDSSPLNFAPKPLTQRLSKLNA